MLRILRRSSHRGTEAWRPALTSTAVDRVHFLDEQRRNRRRSLRFGVFAVVAVAIAAVPLCVLIAPLLLGGLLVIAHIVNLVAPLGAEQWAMLREAIFVGPTIYRKLVGQDAVITWRALVGLYLAPPATFMLLAWPFVYLLSRRAGARVLVDMFISRSPDTTRLTEQQMVNVVGEMALAANVPPPAVRVTGSPTVNAAALGLGVNDVTVLVTHGFLERLNRDERQAIVAHLIGSVGNGDLEIAATIFSVFETWALGAALLETPLSARRRAFVRKFFRLAYAEVRGQADESEAREVISALLGGSTTDIDEVIGAFEHLQPKSVRQGCFLVLVRVPIFALVGLSAIAAREATNLFTVLVLGPWLSAMWRARRRLADATAVQMTRNPEALASAVRTLDTSDVEVPRGWLVHFLFPVWVQVTTQSAADLIAPVTNMPRMRLETEPRLRHLAALGASMAAGERVGTVARFRAVLPSWSDLRELAWLVLLASGAVLLLVLLSMVGASVALMALWYLLRGIATLVS